MASVTLNAEEWNEWKERIVKLEAKREDTEAHMTSLQNAVTLQERMDKMETSFTNWQLMMETKTMEIDQWQVGKNSQLAEIDKRMETMEKEMVKIERINSEKKNKRPIYEEKVVLDLGNINVENFRAWKKKFLIFAKGKAPELHDKITSIEKWDRGIEVCLSHEVNNDIHALFSLKLDGDLQAMLGAADENKGGTVVWKELMKRSKMVQDKMMQSVEAKLATYKPAKGLK